MGKIYFTTVVRAAPINIGGEIVKLDWEQKKVEQKRMLFPINPEIDDPNPRGNARGGRGIECIDDKVFVSTYHSIEVCTRTLERSHLITNNNFAGIHEIYHTQDGLWVASTALDVAVKVNITDGNTIESIWPRELPKIAEKLSLDNIVIDKEADNRTKFLHLTIQYKGKSHLHLNAATPWQDHVYALLNRQGAIVDLTADEVVIVADELRGAHNLVISPEGKGYVNSTKGGRVLVIDINNGTRLVNEEIILSEYREVQDLVKKARPSLKKKLALKVLSKPTVASPLFWRGMDLHEGRLFVGTSPATIFCFDLKTKEMVDFYQYSDDVHVAVHGLKVVME